MALDFPNAPGSGQPFYTWHWDGVKWAAAGTDPAAPLIGVKSFGAAGDGISDDTTAIIDAVAYAIANDAEPVVWPPGTYVTTGSIPNFHNVPHVGPGVLKRGTDFWYITPLGDEQNIIYVGSPNLTANDGLSASEPTNISNAISRMRNIGGKAQDGRWRILIRGTITSTGVTMQDMPAFRNRFEIWGEAADLDSVPTTVWDGASSGASYALRVDSLYTSAPINLHFRNIKFINWDSSSNAGGIVAWGAGHVLSENIHADDCSIGAWYRHCYVKHTHGTIENATTFGVCVQYGATGNIGNLSGDGVTFVGCVVGVNASRQVTCYIQGCSFTGGSVCIEVSRNSRIRTQANSFVSWTNTIVNCLLNSVWTPDNGDGNPDTYGAITMDTPAYRPSMGSVHLHIDRLTTRTLNAYNQHGSVATITSTTRTLLGSAPGVTAGDFVPARVPSWWAYSPTAYLEVQLYTILAANAGGLLELLGVGSSAAQFLGSIDISAEAMARSGLITIRFMQRGTAASGRFYSDVILGGGSANPAVFNVGSSASLNNSGIRTNSEDILNYRLYWTSDTADQVQFADMRSYIEG